MIMDFLKKQFIDVIEWDWQDDDILMWKYPMQDNEIQNGAVLTVRDGQIAVFVNEGQVADVFSPGKHKLTTATLPLLTNLKNWDKLFASPFKSDVLFFNTRLQQGRKWGTTQPVTVRDSEFGMVQVRAFGMYTYRLNDPAEFYKNITGMDTNYTSEQIEPQLRNLINANLANSLGNSPVPFIDLAANQIEMGNEIQKSLVDNFLGLGLSLEAIIVENVSLPPALQEALDKRMTMGVLGDMGAYTQYQTAEAITLAAENEGGIAGIGAGLGVGMNMGNVMGAAMGNQMPNAMNPQMANQMNAQMTGQMPNAQVQAQQAQATMQQPNQAQPNAQPAPASAPQEDYTAKLIKLKTLLDQELITQADFDAAKTEILAKLTQ